MSDVSWRDHVKPMTDRLKLAASFDMVIEYDAAGAAELRDLILNMAEHLDAIKADAQAMAALRLVFRG